MLFSVNWLKDYVDLDDDVEALSHRLTMAGLPVEGIESRGRIPEGVVVGRVLEASRHPNADRLSLCRVDAGTGEPVQVVCGAPNVREGMLSPFAPVGTVLAGGLKLKKSKIRGEVSFGMLCAEDELGLGENHDGIIELTGGEPGQPVSEILGEGDVVLDVDITANRGDCMSHLGLARELAALTGKPLRRPAVGAEETGKPTSAQISVAIEDSSDCPRYIGRVVRGVTVGPSPEWMVRRLEAAGQRSINNMVDITNFVLLESGQPLHAFDLSLLPAAKIGVRRAKASETLTTLDGVDRKLDEDILVITDEDRPVALAGVMGGGNTEVGEATTDILLESAVFHPGRVLRGSRKLRLDTEAALRFRRGVDPVGTEWAIDRAAALMAELGGGAVAPGRVDAVEPSALKRRRVEFRPSRVEALIGERWPEPEIRSRLESFGFEIVDSSEGVWSVAVPTWRPDILEECDLIEEVARHGGYDSIGVRSGNLSAVAAPIQENEVRLAHASQVLRGFGFHEAITRVLTDRTAAARVSIPETEAARVAVLIPDPPSREEESLRVSLAPSLLEVLGHNLRRGRSETRVFELGKTFASRGASELPDETLWVGLAASGGEFAPSRERGLRVYDFFDFKGTIESLCAAFEIDATGWRAYTGDALFPPGCIELILDGKSAGFAWDVDASTRSQWDIKRPVYVAQVRFDALRSANREPRRYRDVPRFPSVKRDLALIVPSTVEQAAVRAKIENKAGAFLESLELFDYYQGKHIPDGHVGLGFTLTFRVADRTLAEDEVDQAVESVMTVLRKDGVELRDS